MYQNLVRFFLGILLVQILLPAIFFLPVKKTIKEWAAEAISLSSTELETIELSRKDFASIKVKGENEIVLQGEYFDIKEVRWENSTAILTVFKDIKETSLFESLASFFGKKTNHSSNEFSFFCKLFDPFLCTQKTTFVTFRNAEKITFRKEKIVYSSPTLSYVTPPPDSAIG